MSILGFEFVLQFLPKTTNSGGRAHWAVKAKEARAIKNMVFLKCSRLKCRDQKWKKATLTLTRFSAIRPDYDGLVSSFKHVIDGLVDAGVIENDTHEVIGVPTYEWFYAKPKEGKIKVRVEGK